MLRLKDLEEINFRCVSVTPEIMLQLLSAQTDLKILRSISVMISSVVDDEIPVTHNEMSVQYVSTGEPKRARISRSLV